MINVKFSCHIFISTYFNFILVIRDFLRWLANPRLELVRDRSRNSLIERQGRAIWKWRRACTRGHASRQRLAYICPRGRVRRTPVDPVCRFVQVSQRLLRVVLNFNRAEEAKERRNRPADAARTRTHHDIQNHGLTNPFLEKLSVRFFSLSSDIQKMLFEVLLFNSHFLIVCYYWWTMFTWYREG